MRLGGAFTTKAGFYKISNVAELKVDDELFLCVNDITEPVLPITTDFLAQKDELVEQRDDLVRQMSQYENDVGDEDVDAKMDQLGEELGNPIEEVKRMEDVIKTQ